MNEKLLLALISSKKLKLLLSYSDAAKLCGYTNSLISSQVKSGQIKVFQLFGERSNPRIPLTALFEWIEERTTILQQEIK